MEPAETPNRMSPLVTYVPRTYERLSWTPTPPAWPSYIPLGTGHPVPSLCMLQGRSHILHAFLKLVTAVAKEAKCKLTIPSKEQSNDDRWMQVRGPVGQAGGLRHTRGPPLLGLGLAACWPPLLRWAGSEEPLRVLAHGVSGK